MGTWELQASHCLLGSRFPASGDQVFGVFDAFQDAGLIITSSSGLSMVPRIRVRSGSGLAERFRRQRCKVEQSLRAGRGRKRRVQVGEGSEEFVVRGEIYVVAWKECPIAKFGVQNPHPPLPSWLTGKMSVSLHTSFSAAFETPNPWNLEPPNFLPRDGSPPNNDNQSHPVRPVPKDRPERISTSCPARGGVPIPSSWDGLNGQSWRRSQPLGRFL